MIDFAERENLARCEWFARRLEKHHAIPSAREIFAGVTDHGKRVGRIQLAIHRAGIKTVIVGRHPVTRKPMSYADAFERAFGKSVEWEAHHKGPMDWKALAEQPVPSTHNRGSQA
jgi:hypothetical protein